MEIHNYFCSKTNLRKENKKGGGYTYLGKGGWIGIPSIGKGV
jgi:hypothetical protein